MNDAFDQWWEWAEKPFSDMATIPADIPDPHGLASRGSPRPDEGQRSRAAVSMRPAPRLSAGPGGRSPADGGIHPGNRQQRQSCV